MSRAYFYAVHYKILEEIFIRLFVIREFHVHLQLKLYYQSVKVIIKMIAKPIEVKALDNYTIFVSFSDGVQGYVDLKHLAKKGIFNEWDKNNLFSQVHINDCGAISWNDDIDICPDNVYLKLQELTFEQWQQQNQFQYASN